jgi:hypothetical protein
MPLIPQPWADRLHFLALGLITVGLPLSRFLMSLGMILLVLEWLLGGGIGERTRKAFSDPALLWLLAFFGIHLLGLLHTTDLQEAFEGIRVKLPLLLLPITVRGRSNGVGRYPFVIAFMGAFFLSSFLSYLGWVRFLDLPWQAGQEATLFISAIRLSLMGCMALFFASFLIEEKQKRGTALLLLLFMLWTLFYLSVLATGISMLVILALCLYQLDRWRRTRKRTLPLILMIGLVLAPGGYLLWEVQDFYALDGSPLNRSKGLPERTANGGVYDHDLDDRAIENGYYVRRFICEPELKKAWNARSKIPFSGKDREGNILQATLIRYMSSKGLKKDAEGMKKMDRTDIQRVENGVANLALHRMNPVRKRVRKAIFEIDRYLLGRDPSGNSITQRFEYWRAGWHIIEKNPFIGVGTGDLNREFAKAYEEIDTQLDPEYRHRAHLQFMTCWIAWGPLGFLVFLASLFIPPLRKKAFRNPFFCVFFITLFLSFLTEDTLETQAGVTLFALWNSLLLFKGRKADPNERPS